MPNKWSHGNLVLLASTKVDSVLPKKHSQKCSDNDVNFIDVDFVSITITSGIQNM